MVAIAAVMMSGSQGWAEFYGDSLAYLWLWALGAFVVGLIIGWGYARHAGK